MRVYVDAAPNKWKKVVNKHGKIIRGTYGFKCSGCNEEGDELFTHINGQADYQVEGEAYAILKAVEYAAEQGIGMLEIINDNSAVVGAVMNDFRMKSRKSKAGKYLWVAGKIANEHGVVVSAEWCASEDNKADGLSRVQADLTE